MSKPGALTTKARQKHKKLADQNVKLVTTINHYKGVLINKWHGKIN